MFKKILIANRGEIAIRVAHACRELGIATVGVYSTVDKDSLHLHFVDQRMLIGDASPQASYLNIDRLIQVAKETGAEAIHPGYGFLAENPSFAQSCEAANITFIGPTSEALALVGDKVASRNTVKKIGVPIIPGMEGASTDLARFKEMAQHVGYPVIIKASMGGGGKGMRIVNTEEELETSIAAGRREAKSAFGDETVFLEKYIARPRHIEFQVLRDHHDNTVHLFERECSIQRRHQKIIEETPSPALSGELRESMGEAAKKVIEAAKYTNAGTVEFLLDEKKKFYFLEVNARIQVEHPITEMVTGVDLVRQQILIAAGKKIEFPQSSVQQRGHSIEVRIYAEDPENNFLPSPGTIIFLKEPQGPGIRVDTGIFEKWKVPPHYDPILSKLIVSAATREHAISRMNYALQNYVILGIKSNIGYLKRVINTKFFLRGEYHTHFIDEHEQDLTLKQEEKDNALIAAALGVLARKPGSQGIARIPTDSITTPWQEIGCWEHGRRS